MFDLIDESGQDLKKHGYTVKQLDKYGISVATLVIKTQQKSDEIGLSKGEYYIFNSPFIHELGLDNSMYVINLLISR